MKQASLDIVSAHDIERTLDIFEVLYRGESVDAHAGRVARAQPRP